MRLLFVLFICVRLLGRLQLDNNANTVNSDKGVPLSDLQTCIEYQY